MAVASIPQSVNGSAWIRASAGHTAPWSPNVALARLSISFECLYPVCDWREWNERGMNLVGVALFLAASLTEVGERHDALSYIKGSHGIIVPVPTHSLGLEELDFFGSEIGDMKSATAELSKRNGLEPPKDLNNEH